MAASTSVRPGRFDHAEPRQALRKGRERGCSIYISGEQLEAAGIDPADPAPLYITSASNNRGRRVFVRLYPAASTGSREP